jgi:hypothetical protein
VKKGENMNWQGFDAYENSINHIDCASIFMAKEDKDFLVIISKDGKTGEKLGFNGKNIDDTKLIAPLNHENALVLRSLFPFTSPVMGLKKNVSFGLGDRLGIATAGHIDLFKENDAFPFFAQQSIRELNLTNRTYEDVLDSVSFAVFREGYKKGFGADGDHLKTAKDVEYALSLGYTMITLDCSDHINNDVKPQNIQPLSKYYSEKYLNKSFKIEDFTLVFNEEELGKCVAIYKDAVSFAAEIYGRFLSEGKYKADFEISIDETVSVTTPLAHFFVASELLDAGVSFATIAPRFCGEFQKGIDYIGDTPEFEKEIKVHAAIARNFGYKLSIHSGSDKFSIFPFIGRHTKGQFHLKTAGTSWLEAMRITAEKDPALYREIQNYALSVFDEAKKFYHITADTTKIPPIDSVKDEELSKLFDNNDNLRQLIHITYGFILNLKNAGGSFAFKDRLYRLWRNHEDEYRKALYSHIGKHLQLLGI